VKPPEESVMKPEREGHYWVKVRERHTCDEPKEGVLSDWKIAYFENKRLYDLHGVIGIEEGTRWAVIGTEIDVDEKFVEEIGPEILPPEED
jgi:hypothetical protein